MITLYCWASYGHIILKMKKIIVHFRPVTENRHISNTYAIRGGETAEKRAQTGD